MPIPSLQPNLPNFFYSLFILAVDLFEYKYALHWSLSFSFLTLMYLHKSSFFQRPPLVEDSNTIFLLFFLLFLLPPTDPSPLFPVVVTSFNLDKSAHA